MADALKLRQEAIDDIEILPKVTIHDIPLKREYTEKNKILGNRSIYEVGTNGLIYSDFLFPLKNLTNDELLFSSLYTFILTEVGLKNKTYEEIQAHQSKITGGINASFKLQTNNSSSRKLFLSISSRCLEENFYSMENLIFDTVECIRLMKKNES